MDFAFVAFSAFFVSTLTLFSGFGLGTLLLPVFALFFPVEVAVAATAVVHGANSLFKMAAVGKHVDRVLIVHFGIPAIAAAFGGAAALGYVSHLDEITRYSIGSQIAVVTPVKLAMGCLMVLFALMELLPRLRNLTFDRRYLFVGGLLSGFFGGFSGHQGALRAAFLAKAGVSTEAFVGTNACIAFMVDTARIATYACTFFLGERENPISPDQWPLILTAVLAAFAGVLLGTRFLDKITMQTIQRLTGLLLFAIAIALGSGFL